MLLQKIEKIISYFKFMFLFVFNYFFGKLEFKSYEPKDALIINDMSLSLLIFSSNLKGNRRR